MDMVLVRRCQLVFAAIVAGFLALLPSGADANSKYAAFVMHAHSGDVMLDRYSNSARHPASLTKMMTLYLLFEELEAGRITLDTKLKVSARAAAQPPSKLGVGVGSRIDVETAIEALVVKSANDVAVVVAESVSGSEWNFAKKMTARARALGMTRTTFRNASGLPNKTQVTTAQDMARLAQRLMSDFPQYWPYFSSKEFTWNGRTYRTHNALIKSYEGADGVKTGYTRGSGYNLTTSAKRDGAHLIGVVLGGRSTRTRDAHMREILDTAFASIQSNPDRIASLYRNTPAPRMKPTLLAAASGAASPALALSAPTSKPAPAASDRSVASPPGDDALGVLIAAAAATIKDDAISPEELNDSELARLAALADYDLDTGEGDVEPDLSWGVQIGAFASKVFAQRELEAAAIAAGLKDRVRVVAPFTAADGKTLYRARFSRLTESEATETCAALKQRAIACFPLAENG